MFSNISKYSVISLILLFSITLGGIYTARAQGTENQDGEEEFSPEDIGTRHVLNYQLVPIASIFDALRIMFGTGETQGYLTKRMGDVLAPELIDSYRITMPISLFNMPRDMIQEYLSGLPENENAREPEVLLSNTNPNDCLGYSEILNCANKSFYTQDIIINKEVRTRIASTSDMLNKELRDGQGLLGATAPTDILEPDGETPMYGQRIPSGAMFANLQNALFALTTLLSSQHGTPGDIGSDPGRSLPPILDHDPERFENPSAPGFNTSGPQLGHDFGTFGSSSFDEWSNFDSSPWMQPTRDRMQDAIDRFGGIEGAIQCLGGPLRLAEVAEILGDERTARLISQNIADENCVDEKPPIERTYIEPACRPPQRSLSTVTDTALVLGLASKKVDPDIVWDVFLVPENFLHGIFGINAEQQPPSSIGPGTFRVGTCAWAVSVPGNEAVFISDEDPNAFRLLDLDIN